MLPSCLGLHCPCLWLSAQEFLATGLFEASRLPSFDSPSSHGRAHRTRSSYRRTSWLQAPFPSLFRPSCLLWSWQRASTSMGVAPAPCTFACRNFSIVSLCFSGESMDEACTARGSSGRSFGCTPCVSISGDSARRRRTFDEQLAILARVSPCLRPHQHSQLVTERAAFPTPACFAAGYQDRTCDSVCSRRRDPPRSWCCAQFQTLLCTLP